MKLFNSPLIRGDLEGSLQSDDWVKVRDASSVRVVRPVLLGVVFAVILTTKLI